MRGSRDPDPDVRVRIGVCLGELGAVDPGNLGLSLKSDDTQPIRMYEVRTLTDLDRCMEISVGFHH